MFRQNARARSSRSSRLLLGAAACAAICVTGHPGRAAVLWDGEAGTSWWYNALNWNTNSNDNTTLPNTGSQTGQATEINNGWDFAGDGVVFDPLNDPSTGGPPASPDPYTITNFYLGHQAHSDTLLYDNKFTIKSGTLTTGGVVILSRNTPNRTGHFVHRGGSFLITGSGRLAISNASGSVGIYEYHGGVFEAALTAGAGTAGVRIGGDSTSSGLGTAWFVVHNDGAAGRIKASNILVSSSTGPPNSAGTVGYMQFHYSNPTTSGNFGVRPVQVVNNFSLRNSATQSARLNLVLDQQPLVDGGGVPQNLGLVWLDDTTGNRTGATGSDPSTQIFWDASGTIPYTPGATVRSVFGTRYYDWTIAYNGEIVFSDASNSQISNIISAGNNNDVVLMGLGSQLGSQWTSSSNTWGNAGSWSGDVPDAPGVIANFLDVPAAATDVTTNAAFTAGHINFDNSNSYNITGSNTVTLDIAGSNVPGAYAFINVYNGSHAISAPLALADNTKLNVAPGSTLTLSNLQPAAGVGISKTGGGTVRANHVRAASLEIAAGKVAILSDGTSDGTSNVTTLTLAAGAQLDLSDNKLVTGSAIGTYVAGAYTGITGHVASGRNGGAWNGAGIITSQAAAAPGSALTTLGVATGEQVKQIVDAETALWAGQTITATDTLVMYTYAGDANLDGSIDGDDFTQIDAGFSANATGYFNGDFNYSGKIDADDYWLIDANYGRQTTPFSTAAAVEGVTAVPEPAGLSVLLAAGTLMRRRRRMVGRASCPR